jgi:hypothetical protein
LLEQKLFVYASEVGFDICRRRVANRPGHFNKCLRDIFCQSLGDESTERGDSRQRDDSGIPEASFELAFPETFDGDEALAGHCRSAR